MVLFDAVTGWGDGAVLTMLLWCFACVVPHAARDKVMAAAAAPSNVRFVVLLLFTDLSSSFMQPYRLMGRAGALQILVCCWGISWQGSFGNRDLVRAILEAGEPEDCPRIVPSRPSLTGFSQS